MSNRSYLLGSVLLVSFYLIGCGSSAESEQPEPVDAGIDAPTSDGASDSTTDAPKDTGNDSKITDSAGDTFDAPIDSHADTGLADTGADSQTDTGAADTGTADTGTVDTGTADTGTVDTGTADTGTVDSGTADTGTADTGTADTGTADTGTADTGTADTGTADSSVVDTGAADTGTADTGSADSSVDVSDSGTDTSSSDSSLSDSSTTDSSTDAGSDASTCEDRYKRCPHTFSFTAGSETTVEFRGDYKADGWFSGIPFVKNAGQWTATADVPYDFAFAYKFFANGTTWVVDPSNPSTTNDPQWGTSSLYSAQTCTNYKCSTESAPVTCDPTLRSCSHLFRYPAGSETSVEIRGDFSPTGWTQGVAMQKSGGFWSAHVDLGWGSNVQYKFVVNGSTWIMDPSNPDTADDGYGGLNSRVSNVSCGWWNCTTAPALTNDWQDSIMYFAFVDRFLDGNASNNGAAVSGVDPSAGYKGGDFAGITQKINDGYFTDLGVNTIWLTVPMDNTEAAGLGVDGHLYSGYHGYWPYALDQTESRFGTMAELKGLVDAAHSKKIRIILDYAMNHMHQSAPIYTQHSDWFWPKDISGQPCICGSAACGWDSVNAKRCWFTDYLPDFNFTNQQAREYSVNNVLWWLNQTGADGLRLDAIKHVEDQWILDLRAKLKTDIEPTTQQHVYIVGETYSSDRALIKNYVNSGMLDGQFDFPLRAQLVNSLLLRSSPMSSLAGFLDSNDSFYGNSAVMSTFIGNHDVPRSIHFAQDQPIWTDAWADGKDKSWSGQPALPTSSSAFERLVNAFTLMFTTKGIPLVYYGDEVGMPGAGDPDNRRMMQWSGYSSGQQFLYNQVKKLASIRSKYVSLRRGTRTSLSSDASTMVYKMAFGTETVYVAINASDTARSVSSLPSGSLKELLSNTTISGPSVNLPARSAYILTSP